MPLPDESIPWPPKRLEPILPKLEEWSAWYSGDANALARQYGAFGNGNAGPRPRPAQHAGGVVGAVARWFWGAPQAPGQQRTKIHVPVAADIATASADLLFSEAVKITPPAENAAAQDRLDVILEGNDWQALLLEHGEVCAALGGAYLRVMWDRELEPNHPIVSVVHADAAWPEFAYGRLRAVTFWQVLAEDGLKRFRLLERHEPGRQEWGLYEGTIDRLGRRIPLPEDLGLTVDQQAGQDTNWPGLTAVYVPNMRPNRLWRNEPLGSQLGRSDLDQIEPLMDAIDETMTSWMRDIRLGKGRVIVPNYMLQNGGPGRESTFNIDQEVFTGLALPPAEEGGDTKAMTAQQFAIRTAEHADTIRGLLAAALRTAGYSASTFGMADEAAPTATEVTARDRRSETTREKKTRYYSSGLARFIRALLSIDTAQGFAGNVGAVDWLPTVTFPPASRPSQEVEARTVQTLRAAELMSIDTGVRRINPDWDDQEVADEVARIMDDRPAPMPDPFAAAPGEEGGGDPVQPAGGPIEQLDQLGA